MSPKRGFIIGNNAWRRDHQRIGAAWQQSRFPIHFCHLPSERSRSHLGANRPPVYRLYSCGNYRFCRMSIGPKSMISSSGVKRTRPGLTGGGGADGWRARISICSIAIASRDCDSRIGSKQRLVSLTVRLATRPHNSCHNSTHAIASRFDRWKKSSRESLLMRHLTLPVCSNTESWPSSSRALNLPAQR